MKPGLSTQYQCVTLVLIQIIPTLIRVDLKYDSPREFGGVFETMITPQFCRDMNPVFIAVTVSSRDAGAEPTRMYSRRVTAKNTGFMSRLSRLRLIMYKKRK